MGNDSDSLSKTVLHEWHEANAKTMHEFAGYHMPIEYESTINEHLAVRTAAGLFDVSHMGRFKITGKDALSFLQYSLTNNALALDKNGMSQYTIIQDKKGNAVDDAYLYRTGKDEFMLVVNASNREKDWNWLDNIRKNKDFDVKIGDISDELAMLSLQGPNSTAILEEILVKKGNTGSLPEPKRNHSSVVSINGKEVRIARTGYTGESVCYELLPTTDNTEALWKDILSFSEKYGVKPVGLGARDTLRLEAGLPLYGHELGLSPDGKLIPIYAIPLARTAVSFAPEKGVFLGKKALLKQAEERTERVRHRLPDVPLEERVVKRVIRPVAIVNKDLTGPGNKPPRAGHEIYYNGKLVGYVTSGTTVPYWTFSGEGIRAVPSGEAMKRPIALALIDSDIANPYNPEIDPKFWRVLTIKDERERESRGLVVPSHMKAPPSFVRPQIHPKKKPHILEESDDSYSRKIQILTNRAVDNTLWRQSNTINLIPSENTPSRLVRQFLGMDPLGRYAEHILDGSLDFETFYYQATNFIGWVERELNAEMKKFLGSTAIESRVISGQQANKAVFEGLVKHINRAGKKGDQFELMKSVITNYLGYGGHLSSQPLGALFGAVAKDTSLDRWGVHNFPIRNDNPYMIDVEKAIELIYKKHPQLIVFGKSMVLHPEPIKEIADVVKEMKRRPVIMYDAAHVLGLLGKYFQEPFKEGADIVTGSTHKTYFGTQRGIIAANVTPTLNDKLWNSIYKRAFPGQMSNHHLGTMLGLLVATYEMLEYGDAYQQQVLSNAKAFAKALKDHGLKVEGDPNLGYTETHQVILNVGNGPDIAELLEKNNIITNYQSLPRPTDLSFSNSSGIRMGVQEMTRFGMKEKDFYQLADYIAEAIKGKDVKEEVAEYRKNFLQMEYVFPDMDKMVSKLQRA